MVNALRHFCCVRGFLPAGNEHGSMRSMSASVTYCVSVPCHKFVQLRGLCSHVGAEPSNSNSNSNTGYS